LHLEIEAFLELLRLKSKTLTGRSINRINSFIIKTYNNFNESAYEYCVFSKIALSKPIAFRAPRVFKFLKTQNNSALIMEHIEGHGLDNFILGFLLCNNPYAFKIFYWLGETVNLRPPTMLSIFLKLLACKWESKR